MLPHSPPHPNPHPPNPNCNLKPSAAASGRRSIHADRRGWDGDPAVDGGSGGLDAALRICLIVDLPAPCLHGSRGCLGCCTKPTPIIAVDEPSKGLRIQGRTVQKPSISEDFWSTSTYEMDNSGIQSQRSISSISTSTQNIDPHGAASTSNPTEFVNHGLLLWNQTRQQWVGNRKPETRMQEVKEPRLSWNVTYDSLLGTNKPFPQHIPLSEMVDFLVDVWEQEGMYD